MVGGSPGHFGQSYTKYYPPTPLTSPSLTFRLRSFGDWKPGTCLFVTSDILFFLVRQMRPCIKRNENVAALLRQYEFVSYFLLHVRIGIKTLQGFESKCQVSFDLRTRSGEIMRKYAQRRQYIARKSKICGKNEINCH